MASRQIVVSKLREKDAGTSFEFNYYDKSYLATVMPFVGENQKPEDQKRVTAIRIKGIEFQYDDQKRLAKNTDQNGNTTEYGFDSGGSG